MIKQEYQPATPTFMNTGKSRGGEMVSCFLLESDDSLNSINYNLNTMGQLSKIGGGVSCNLSKIRSRGEAIKGVEGASSGVVPVMKLMEDTFSYVNQLGQRAGAGVAYLNIFHWDIEEFLETKKISCDEKSRLQTLSIGVVIPDKFVELAKENKPFYVFAPYTVYKQCGEIINLILRDEKLHTIACGRFAQDLMLNVDDATKDHYKKKALELISEIYNLEMEYTELIYGDLGLVEEVETYVQFNVNYALECLGFEPMFNIEEKDVNAIVLNGYSIETKTHDFFSTRGNGYVVATNVTKLTDEDFVF